LDRPLFFSSPNFFSEDAIVAHKTFTSSDGREKLAKKHPIISRMPRFEYTGIILSGKKRKKVVLRIDRTGLVTVFKGASLSISEVWVGRREGKRVGEERKG
jgi:hypothetical protein